MEVEEQAPINSIYNPKLKDLAQAHIDSFNFFLDEGLGLIEKYLKPVEIYAENLTHSKVKPYFKYCKLWFEDLHIGTPSHMNDMSKTDTRILPSDCRIAKKSYSAPLLAVACRKIDDGPIEKTRISLEEIPIMVGSKKCHLSSMAGIEQAVNREEGCEIGGYFIINGLEKILRLLIVSKYNHPIGLIRGTFRKRDSNFTNYAIQIKSMREDLYSQSVLLHYTHDGNLKINIKIRKKEYLLPAIVVIKALEDISDYELYNQLVRGDVHNSFITDRVEVLLRDTKKRGTFTQSQCLSYLGFLMKKPLGITNPNLSLEEIGKILIDEYFLVHCRTNNEKFHTLCLMIHKIYCMVSLTLDNDNTDSLTNQSVLLPGHLYMMLLREKLETSLATMRAVAIKDLQNEKEIISFKSEGYIHKLLKVIDIGKRMEQFISTGNLLSKSGLDLTEPNGYSIIADKLNAQRFYSHFRSLHRGGYFTKMKTTTVRKLLPENWGFICPVHTPDGGLCGLLTHMALTCRVSNKLNYITPAQKLKIIKLCTFFGMHSFYGELKVVLPRDNFIFVTLDEIVIGEISIDKAQVFSENLRKYKVLGLENETIPKEMSITHIPKTTLSKMTQYPGVYLYCVGGRFIRPVHNIQYNTIEWIDPIEQCYLNIACTEEDIRFDTTHQEIDPSNILSELANQIPFLNYNQSPRTMYQCQMAKQTMGTAYHSHPYRFDNKVYRIMNPQRPLVRCENYDELAFGEYPSGTNAIVAVISYTGYDMEDAMIINKSSYERGFGHGCIYKSIPISLNSVLGSSSGKKGSSMKLLHTVKDKITPQMMKNLDDVDGDGFPPVGSQLSKGNTEFAYYDLSKNVIKNVPYKDSEKGYIEQVAMIGGDNQKDSELFLKFRISRNPVIGDKFSSRHGQKGVLSTLWPHVDMPFSENGITPDVIINPHAFPSRMTIGMLIESMAGKMGAMKGENQEVKSFQPVLKDNMVEYFGKKLKEYGYNYYGTETMYSGVFGSPFNCDIYMGVVYYQRLRHMVSDKSQARATGRNEVLTRQPVKGRKKGGGIRMGEMERDALIAHGISFCLHDRLLNCSDYSEGYVCKKCGSLISTYMKLTRENDKIQDSLNKNPANPNKNLKVWSRSAYCKACDSNDCEKVILPFVLRYLTNELAAMSIKLNFKIQALIYCIYHTHMYNCDRFNVIIYIYILLKTITNLLCKFKVYNKRVIEQLKNKFAQTFLFYFDSKHSKAKACEILQS